MFGETAIFGATPASQTGNNKRSAVRPAPPCFLKKLARTGPLGTPSFAVALNCGMASSSLKADVKAFDRLRIVRGGNSSYFGSK